VVSSLSRFLSQVPHREPDHRGITAHQPAQTPHIGTGPERCARGNPSDYGQAHRRLHLNFRSSANNSFPGRHRGNQEKKDLTIISRAKPSTINNEVARIMKRVFFFIFCCLFLSVGVFAQKLDTFDIISFKTPNGWQKEASRNAVQLGVDGGATGGTCLITMFKPLPGSSDAKVNFNASWETIVKETVSVSGSPQMQPTISKNGWTAESGLAPYKAGEKKGVVLLVTLSGQSKMVNILILTDSDKFQQAITDFLASVELPEAKAAAVPPKIKPAETTPLARKSDFHFSTTNFDDGWTGAEQEDWVEVVKGKIKVLIHYPKKGTIFPADPEPLTNAAWNILVAPRYSNLKNYKTAYISTSNRPYLGMGYALEKTSGKQVFVLLFRQGDTGWLEFIAPDKDSFVQQYKFDPETIKWDSDTDLLKPLVQMANYNKFAVAESDFTGTWTSDFTGVQQLYNVYTGNYAGMNINQSNEEFVFGGGASYSWKLLAVNGVVGNIKYAGVNSVGTFRVLNNWQVHFSKIESRAKTYNAHWSCIKGGRLLHLIDANAPGSGIYTVYGKK
jgi:hypothetical protein